MNIRTTNRSDNTLLTPSRPNHNPRKPPVTPHHWRLFPFPPPTTTPKPHQRNDPNQHSRSIRSNHHPSFHHSKNYPMYDSTYLNKLPILPANLQINQLPKNQLTLAQCTYCVLSWFKSGKKKNLTVIGILGIIDLPERRDRNRITVHYQIHWSNVTSLLMTHTTQGTHRAHIGRTFMLLFSSNVLSFLCVLSITL